MTHRLAITEEDLRRHVWFICVSDHGEHNIKRSRRFKYKESYSIFQIDDEQSLTDSAYFATVKYISFLEGDIPPMGTRRKRRKLRVSYRQFRSMYSIDSHDMEELRIERGIPILVPEDKMTEEDFFYLQLGGEFAPHLI